MLDLFFRIEYFIGVLQGRFITGARNFNVIPFYTIKEFMEKAEDNPWLAIYNILGNIIVFIPYGMYLPIIKKSNRLGENMSVVLLTSLIIEIIQYIFNVGAFDVDDLILNTLGGFIGISAYFIMLKIFKRREKAKNVIAMLSLAVGVPIIFLGLILLWHN